ncbi:MAG: GNAT family N-acetyltransferase [Candidatus Bathyarchaeota archaeon]|nr:GNAT family N-acetyltransferase [Candidatus Bathyarchaeota archaeon]
MRGAWSKENRLTEGFEVFMAEIEGKIVGFTVFKIERDYGYIGNIVVARVRRRKGVGQALVAFVEDTAKNKGYNSVKTDTTENAEGAPWKAYGFWIKLGYEDKEKRLGKTEVAAMCTQHAFISEARTTIGKTVQHINEGTNHGGTKSTRT